MTLLRYLLLAALLATAVTAGSDGGPGMDPNGGPRTSSARCAGDYTACVDPNG